MGTDKRARQKANRRAAIDHARIEAARQRRRQRLVTYGAIVVVGVFFIGLVAWLLSRDTDDDVAADAADATDSSLDDDLFGDGTDPALPPAITTPPAGATSEGPTDCPAEDGSSERTTTFAEPPPMCIDPDADYQAEIVTSAGTITADLDPAAAPLAVNNFVVLSRYHFYDGVPFHRVIDDFMIQGGDATGSPPGTGSPGYQFEDELPGDDYVYQPGDLAMANSGPDSNGSQFFIVTREAGVDHLAGAHTLFGRVTAGMDVVASIEALDSGDGAGTPLEEVVIESITISELPGGGSGPSSTGPDSDATTSAPPATEASTTTTAG